MNLLLTKERNLISFLITYFISREFSNTAWCRLFIDFEAQRCFRLGPDVACARHAAMRIVISSRRTAIGPSRAATSELAMEFLLTHLVPPAGSLKH